MEKSVAAKVSNHIYDDVALVILSKLPLKSLFRFCCVRKSWSVLFQNPYFMDMFRRNFSSMDHSYYNDASIILYHTPSHYGSPAVLYSLFGERVENIVKLDWPNPLDYTFFYPRGSGSVNGIFCMEGMMRESYRDKKLVFWNPATREFKVIPPSPFAVESPYWHPFIEFYGFGYDQVRDDYKVIRRIFFSEDDWERSDDELPDTLWEIYCLKSNKWRKLDLNMPAYYRSTVGAQMYTDGVCHWWNREYLVSFDLSNETFVKTFIPSNIDYFDSTTAIVNRSLFVLNGSIGLISKYHETSTFHISILGEVGIKESWIKLSIVGPLSCVLYPIGIGKKGNIFFLKKDYKLVWFNLNTQKIEELDLKDCRCCQIMIYKENFLPFERINN
jgi:molecular chaperone HtpG